MKLNQILRSRSGSQDKRGPPNTVQNPLSLQKKTMSGVVQANESMSKGSSFSHSTQQKTTNQFKISKINNDALMAAFRNITKNFAAEIDYYFKNYNKFIKESMNKIDVQVKASKKEKVRHQQFLAREELLYWSDFPRKRPFYHADLAKIKQICTEGVNYSQERNGVFQPPINEIRDFDFIAQAVLDYLPENSRKYCQRFQLNWEMKSPSSTQESAAFDKLTQNLSMFDSDSARNWQILGLLVNLMVADVLSVLLDLTEQELGLAIAPVHLSLDMSLRMLQKCKNLAQPTPEQNFDVDSQTIIDSLYEQVQYVWSNKIFPGISQLSSHHFDACLKLIQSPLQSDHRKLHPSEVELLTHQIYFGRFLAIAPKDLEMGAKVLSLLDTCLQFMLEKSVADEFKQSLLATLRYLISKLCFYQDTKSSGFDSKAMQIQWDRVTKIYQAAEKLSKRDLFREQAYMLMAQILKVASEDFTDQFMDNFQETVKINQLFQSRSTYSWDLRIVCTLYVNQYCPQKYKSWWPQTELKKNLLWGTDGEKIVTPICFKTTPLNHVKLARKPYFIGSVSDTFQMIFNPKILSTLTIEHSHWIFLEQASFDELEFVCKQGLTMLLDQRFADKGTHILNIGLKLAKFLLDPASGFKEKYIQVHGPLTAKGKNLSNCLAVVNKLLCEAIKDIFVQKLNLRTDFMQNCLHFFKLHEAKNLCSDQTSIIWTQLDEELILKQTYAISRDLKSQGLAKFHLQDKPRTITFEDLNEIDVLTYENPFMNKLVKELGKNVEQLWDRKKEMFIRHRIECFFGEAEEGTMLGKQNTFMYQEVPHQRMQALKMVRRIISCLNFLPDMQEFFTNFPTHSLLVERKSILASQVPLIQLAKVSPDSSPKFADEQSGQLLSEAINLLPYLTLCLDFKIVEKTMQYLCQVMVTGTVKTKMAMIDQLIYIVKELALSSPEHHLIPQLLNLLQTMIKVWHHFEKFKMLLISRHFKVGENLGQTSYKVISLGATLSQTKDTVNEPLKHMMQFDLLDMISFLGLANQDLNVRQNSLILLQETAKLKRLLVHKDRACDSLFDVLQNTRDHVKTQIAEKLSVFYCFKGYGHKDWGYFYELLSEKDFFHFAVDNFEYAKAGLWESLVRDIQILFFGEIAQQWKKSLSENLLAKQIFQFMWKLTTRCTNNYQIMAGRGSHEAVAQNQEVKSDNVGFNLLLALVISNVSESQDPQSQPFQGRTTNTILEKIGTIVRLTESNFNQMHKIPFGKFYPSRMWTSNIMMAFLYYLQNDNSLDNLAEIFSVQLQSDEQFAQNCLLFNSLLSQGGNESFTYYIRKQVLADESKGICSSGHLKAWVSLYKQLEMIDLQDDDLGKKKTILKIVLANGICSTLKKLRDETNNLVVSTDYLPIKLQLRILSETRANYSSIMKSSEIQWLAPKIKQIWFSLLTFEEEQLLNDPKAKLDLKFLIQLEKEGFTGSLRFYKYFSKAESDGKIVSSTGESNKVSEIKLLIQHVYSCNDKGTAIKQNLSNTINSIADQSQILSAANVSAISLADQMQSQVNYQKNVYFKCLATCLFDSNVLQAELMNLFESRSFETIYSHICNSIFPTSSKVNMQSKLKKLSGYNLHAKIFLVALFVSLNAVDHSFVEKARVLALSFLPLMFGELKYRKEVEQKLCLTPNLKLLVNFENKQFYQFIKQVFKDEEVFNMQYHFEKFFSMSGFLRDLLNEIIKLQSNDSDGQPQVGPKHLLRVLDIVTYFFSGHLDLRRAPKVQSEDRQESFIFANLIDYKSFEFLSKLYKISEKLIDHDGDMLVMNMWYKVVENRPHNFEILAKFLIHNLSSFIMKLKASVVEKSESQQDEVSYGIEYEKHKRFSLSIFNYIKARTQQLDLRNSLNVSSVTWSQKMLKIVLRAQMNLQSKYTLEKLKLKKVLQMLHGEINQSGLRLQLKGGLETLNQMMAVGEQDTMMDSVRSSVSMSQLLESKTFLSTFGGHNRREASTVKQLVFIVSRQMSEKFEELTPDIQIEQLPDLIIKYFENTLILIANEAERLQIVKYTLKEELTVTILVLLLVADLATQTKSDVNRYYFMYDLINKLAMSIAGIQKYLKLNSLSMDQFMAIQTVEDLLNMFNYRNTFEIFGLFTKLYYKVLINVTCMPDVHSFLLQMWLMTLSKHMQLKEVEAITVPFYSRDQNLVMFKGCFFTLHQISMKTKHGSIGLKDQQKVRKLFDNFHQQIDCVLEYINPKGNKTAQMKQFSDHYAEHISFATNSAFWLSYACLEMAVIAEETNKQVVKLQITGMRAMRRILEESDFLKLLIGINKLSPHFYRYSLSLPQKKTSLLELLFETLMNPEARLDAYKGLMVTIRILDQQLLSSGSDENEVGRDELNRMLLLLPFFLQQFIVSEEQSTRQSTAVLFSNKRNIVQLLKKSLPSIGIDKKKEVLSILDVIQREADHNDQELIREQFMLLVKAVVDSCFTLNHSSVISRSLRILRTMMYNAEEDSSSPVVENHIIKAFYDAIQEQIQKRGHQDLKLEDNPFADLKEEFYSVYELLGEEVCQVSKDLRPLYFGLKNIILKEIENIDKEIDVQQFFVQEDSAIPIRSASGLSSGTISPYIGLLKKSSVNSTGGMGSSRASIPGSTGRASVTKQEAGNSESDNGTNKNFILKPTPGNLLSQKQEMATKYMNSQNVIASNPSPSTILKSQSVSKTQIAILETGSDNNAYVLSSVNNTTRKSFKQAQSPITNGNNISDVIEANQEQSAKDIIHEIEELAEQEFSPPDVFKKRQQEISQLLFEDDDSNEQAQVSAVDKALEGASKTFAENVIQEESKLQLNRTEYVDETPREVEGLIGTFAKPQTESPAPNIRIKQKQLEREETNAQKQNRLMRGEKAADLGISQQISSISVKHSALRPNFVAEKAGQLLYSELDKNEGREYMEMRPNTGHFSPKEYGFQTDTKLKSQIPRHLQDQPVSEHHSKTLPKQPPRVANFIHEEALPDGVSSQHQSILDLVNDEDRFFDLEQFFDEKSYDVDNFIFYVKVLEFKQEKVQNNANLAAGLIIDNYLAEDAEYYIGGNIKSDKVITDIIKSYERFMFNQHPVEKSLFDKAVDCLLVELEPLLKAFYERSDSNQ